MNDVINTSVSAHLAQSNFNNPEEISSLLQSVGIDTSKVNATFGELKGLMERRHQIVHRADRQMTVVGSGDHEVLSINKQTVRQWAAAVDQFAKSLFPLL